MSTLTTFSQDKLQIDVIDNDNIEVIWRGKSIELKPGKFITPILINALTKSSEMKKRIILNFCDMEYMNSSTITPVIKILDRVKRGNLSLTILYRQSQKWQELMFSALEIFETEDDRVKIKGLS